MLALIYKGCQKISISCFKLAKERSEVRGFPAILDSGDRHLESPTCHMIEVVDSWSVLFHRNTHQNWSKHSRTASVQTVNWRSIVELQSDLIHFLKESFIESTGK